MTKAWLGDLEERVEKAVEQIRSLRTLKGELEEKNRQLEEKYSQLEEDHLRLEESVEGLEKKLSEAEEQLANAGTDEGASEWLEERNEIRGRVEKLVEHLGDLLEEE